MVNSKQKYIIYSVSDNIGIGLWTSICTWFAAIFGVPSKNYKRKVDRVTQSVKRQLESFMKSNPEYDFCDYRIIKDGSISIVGSVMGTLREGQREVGETTTASTDSQQSSSATPKNNNGEVKKETSHPSYATNSSNIYKVDEMIILNQDVTVNGTTLAKGTIGVIDNISYSNGERMYIVIFDQHKGKEFKLSSKLFRRSE